MKLVGTVTRVGEDRDEHTEISVQVDGLGYRVTLTEKWVSRTTAPPYKDERETSNPTTGRNVPAAFWIYCRR